MSIVTRTVAYQEGTTDLEAVVAYDDSLAGARPTVLIAHAWGGRDRFCSDKAEALAKLGYVGFAMDVYGKGILGSGPDENNALMQPLLADRSLLRARLDAGLKTARDLVEVDAGKVAATGYCFGGLCVLDMARMGADLRGVISYHGLLMPAPGLENAAITAKVLVLHGHADPMVPPEQVLALEQEMASSGADWQVHIYGAAAHAFTNPEAADVASGILYHAASDRRSWQTTVNFLQEAFA